MEDKEKEINLDLAPKQSLDEADGAIRMNLFIQAGMAFGLFLLFIFLRRKMPWVYCTNTKSSPTHPARAYTGWLNWLIPVMTISDVEFFDLVGFDAFLFIETLKLLGIIFLLLSFILIPLLGAYYSLFGGGKVTQFLVRISLLTLPNNHRNANAIIPGICTWVVSLGILYFFYMFYRRYIILRQLHLRDRSFSKSTPSIRRLVNEMHSVHKALEEIDLPSRTVLIRNIPAKINGKAAFLEYLKALDLVTESIEECFVVMNTKQLEKLIRRRKETIFKLEKEFQVLFMQMNVLSLEKDFYAKHIQSYDLGMDLISNAIAWSARNPEKEEKNPEKRIKELVSRFISSECVSSLSKENQKISIEKIRECMNTIKALNREIHEEREKAKKVEMPDNVEILLDEKALHDAYEIDRMKPIFFSIWNILHLWRLYREFSQSIPKETRCGFVTFTTVEAANSMKMSLIGTGVFSCKAIEAPAPEEIIWYTLSEPEPARLFRKFVGAVITFVFVVFFMIFVFLVSSLINISTFDHIVMWVNPQLQAITSTPGFRSTFQAILIPSLYSFFLSLAPVALNAICLFEGSMSHTHFQKNFGKKYLFFLFVNGFLGLIFSTTMVSILDREKEQTDIFEMISIPVVSSSIFFLNTLIQKTFFGLMMVLIEPGRIFFRLVENFLGGIRTRREEIDSYQPERINFGYHYPQVFLTFPMVLIYTVICPPFFLIGALYFLGAYLVYKTLFMYSHVSDTESGGGHWSLLCSSIFYSLLTFQVINIAHFLALRQYVILVFIVPLLVITVGMWQSFQNIFQERFNYLPSSSKELEEGSRFMYKVSLMRREQIKEWKESQTIEKDVLTLTKETINTRKDSYIYRDLSFLPSSCSAILPKWFYATIRYLVANGDNDIFSI
ncbi:calcium permeable stress-gated cation channel [Nematocida sp. LUAm3]|nr:calcium permeable stress-gated cation channel [Nematocida sp. LUAm3]KAI5175335.1 calcium permeable stress-gated cation channel [Nematocida sp. LUAm2]KAI5177708.1 calcium permeable stress-gated cation channel [Nematocida sp. LUAm1]